MVYISNGTVQKNQPWSLRRLFGFFWGIIAFIIYFFKTLVGLDTSSGSPSSSRGGHGGSNGGPGGGGPGGGFKRIGRITTIDDCSMPGGG